MVGRLVFSSFFRHFWSPWARKINQNRSNSQNRRKKRKIIKKQKQTTIFSILGPKMDRKWTKNGPGAEKVRLEAAPEAIFFVLCRRRCSESLPEPNFGGSDPSKLYYFHSGSTILTKSPFSKKHRKSSLRGPVLGAKMAKSRRRGDPKSKKSVKK